jgi:hypothetical protein
MEVVIKKGMGRKNLSVALDNMKQGKRFDAKKHAGRIKLVKRPLEIQKAMRDEWE